MKPFRFEVATRAHAERLAPVLHPEERLVVCAPGRTPLETCAESVDVSTTAYAVLVEGEVLGLFGAIVSSGWEWVAPHAAVWALNGEAACRHRREFLRASREAVGLLLQLAPVLVGGIDARAAAALRWARHLGFEVDDARADESRFVHPIRLRRAAHV